LMHAAPGAGVGPAQDGLILCVPACVRSGPYCEDRWLETQGVVVMRRRGYLGAGRPSPYDGNERNVATRRFCARPGPHPVAPRPAPIPSDVLAACTAPTLARSSGSGCPSAATQSGAIVRRVWRVVAASPALSANTCATPGAEVSGRLFDFESVGRFVVTDCHYFGGTVRQVATVLACFGRRSRGPLSDRRRARLDRRR